MITLWGRPTSSNVKKVLWTLEELGLDYEHIKVGGAYGGLDDPKLLAMNPNGLIPIIKDDQLVLWESNTIVRYLAARYGKEIMWIEDCGKRAQSEKWMDWTMATLFEPFKNLLNHALRLAEDKRDPKILAASIVDFEKGLAILESDLAKQDYLSSDILSVGDIITGVFVYTYYGLNIKRNLEFHHVENWYKRLQTHPAYCEFVMTPIV